MCSKPLALRGLSPDDLHDDDVFPGSPASVARRRLLGRIADALQVPLATLYDPAAGPVQGTDGVGEIDTAIDYGCLALLHAYKRIADPKERRRLLTLVEEAAARY